VQQQQSAVQQQQSAVQQKRHEQGKQQRKKVAVQLKKFAVLRKSFAGHTRLPKGLWAALVLEGVATALFVGSDGVLLRAIVLPKPARSMKVPQALQQLQGVPKTPREAFLQPRKIRFTANRLDG
jgi:hypothetical protein